MLYLKTCKGLAESVISSSLPMQNFLCASNFLISINTHFQSVLYYGQNYFRSVLFCS